MEEREGGLEISIGHAGAQLVTSVPFTPDLRGRGPKLGPSQSALRWPRWDSNEDQAGGVLAGFQGCDGG